MWNTAAREPSSHFMPSISPLIKTSALVLQCASDSELLHSETISPTNTSRYVCPRLSTSSRQNKDQIRYWTAFQRCPHRVLAIILTEISLHSEPTAEPKECEIFFKFKFFVRVFFPQFLFRSCLTHPVTPVTAALKLTSAQMRLAFCLRNVRLPRDTASSSFCTAGTRPTGDKLTFLINNKKKSYSLHG